MGDRKGCADSRCNAALIPVPALRASSSLKRYLKPSHTTPSFVSPILRGAVGGLGSSLVRSDPVELTGTNTEISGDCCKLFVARIRPYPYGERAEGGGDSP